MTAPLPAHLMHSWRLVLQAISLAPSFWIETNTAAEGDGGALSEEVTICKCCMTRPPRGCGQAVAFMHIVRCRKINS
jgi:hypothetical protein